MDPALISASASLQGKQAPHSTSQAAEPAQGRWPRVLSQMRETDAWGLGTQTAGERSKPTRKGQGFRTCVTFVFDTTFLMNLYHTVFHDGCV